MIKSLLTLRLRGFFAGLTRQSRQKRKKGKGTAILFAVLYLYLAAVIAGLMCLTFGSLAPAYHTIGLDWLYFAMAGIMGLAFALIGSVFTTQSQLYDARDNDLLLSMPIPPRLILLSRVLPLLGLNLVFGGIIMVPAMVMWAILVEFSLVNLLLQLLGLLSVCFLAQAAACLLGWGLHLLLQHMNKSLASALFMVGFLVIYFYVYSQLGDIMNSMAANGGAIAAGIRSWGWIFYALGLGSLGSIAHLLVFAGISLGLFGVVYRILSLTFLKSATSRRSTRQRKLNMGSLKEGNAAQAIIFKEWRHFLGSPVYLTNMGVGVIMTAALAVLGIVFREKILEQLAIYEGAGLTLTPYIPLLICAILSSLAAMMPVSAPSVSLEGKNLWILRSLPVSGKAILEAKFIFHLLLTTPVTVLAGVILSITYGCGIADILLCGLVPGLLTLVCGLLGMVCGLQWAKLDWLSEAYPCKQGAAMSISMLSMMALPVMLAAAYFLLAQWLSEGLFLGLCAIFLSLVSLGLYRAMTTWGVKKWEALL